MLVVSMVFILLEERVQLQPDLRQTLSQERRSGNQDGGARTTTRQRTTLRETTNRKADDAATNMELWKAWTDLFYDKAGAHTVAGQVGLAYRAKRGQLRLLRRG